MPTWEVSLVNQCAYHCLSVRVWVCVSHDKCVHSTIWTGHQDIRRFSALLFKSIFLHHHQVEEHRQRKRRRKMNENSTGAREEGCEEGAEEQGRWKGRRHEHASNCWSLGAWRSPWQHAAPRWAPADITPVEAKRARVRVCVSLSLSEPIRLRRTQGQKQTEEEKGQLCRFDHLLGTAAYMWHTCVCVSVCVCAPFSSEMRESVTSAARPAHASKSFRWPPSLSLLPQQQKQKDGDNAMEGTKIDTFITSLFVSAPVLPQENSFISFFPEN